MRKSEGELNEWGADSNTMKTVHNLANDRPWKGLRIELTLIVDKERGERRICCDEAASAHGKR